MVDFTVSSERLGQRLNHDNFPSDSAFEGPSDLSVSIGNKFDSTVDLNLKWSANNFCSCRYDVIARTSSFDFRSYRNVEADYKTFTIPNVEYWTGYYVTVGYTGNEGSRTEPEMVFTGPGGRSLPFSSSMTFTLGHMILFTGSL